MACVMNCFRCNEADHRADTAGFTSREGFGLRQYSYDELAEATDKFSNRKLLGEGGFGLVYEGTLGGKKVAIKKLKIRPDERSQSEEESEKEIKIVSKVSHKNLVKLFGYCIEGDDILLVLEFVPKKSLRHHLYGAITLEWKRRMKIAIGTAKGLEYLHENCTPKIIHRDIKADNILIDNNYEPKVADFGLALLFPETGSLTHITRSNKGTQVYADPEHYPQKVSEKSDVYSYGVVLLELISGRKTKFEDTDIVTWAKPHIQYALHSGDYTNLVNSKLLQENYNEKEMKVMIFCAAACIYKPSSSRPKMNQIVRALEGYMCTEEIWNEKNDNIFLKDNPKSNGSHNVELNGPYKSKPLISSEANGSHNIESNGFSSEANDGIEQREFTHREPLVATNGSFNATNVTERFQDYPQRKINFQEDNQPRIFTYQELIMATRGFSEDNRLDEGPWGQVYKGDLNGEKVTVKKFNNPRKQEEEYTKMKAIASGFRHRNLVNLIGYCEEGANRLLVYEFVPPGKSFRNSFDDLTEERLSRLIAVCLQQAEIVGDLVNEQAKENFLSWYMSVDWKDKIFLEDDFQLKTAEYGREKFSSHFKVTRNFARCVAPEYTITSKFTKNTTVYSYGVMLLEMITGKEDFDDIVQWGVPQLKRALSNGNYDFVDKRLKAYNKNEMNRMIACALACLRDNPQDRPEMRQIVEVLKGNIDMQVL